MLKILEIKTKLKHYDCWSTLCEAYLCTGKIHYAIKINNSEILEIATLKFRDIELLRHFINISTKKNIIDILYFKRNFNNNVEIMYTLNYDETVRRVFEIFHPILEEVIPMDGFEFWTLFLMIRRKSELSSIVATLVDSLEAKNIKVLDLYYNLYELNSIIDRVVMPLLTDRENEILYKAYTKGFFETPRNITVTELANEIGISKTAVLKILRNSIKKLIKSYFSKVAT
jgi:predicted DNA binding protein